MRIMRMRGQFVGARLPEFQATRLRSPIAGPISRGPPGLNIAERRCKQTA